jgi:tetratricopeptide (TPR) repeat protein
VADVSRTAPDEELAGLLDDWRAAPADERPALTLARAFIERARVRREPRYFGRAEAVLARKASGPAASAELRRLYAETLQFRHDFAAAEVILDALLAEQPHDTDSRLRRGSLRLTRGDFAGARADCVRLTTARGAVALAGLACLAEALAGNGELARALMLMDAMAGDTSTPDHAARAYLLATRGELEERAGNLPAAIGFYRRAASLVPGDDAVRAALADAMVAHGGASASDLLADETPGLAILVRQATLPGAAPTLRQRARTLLALEAARGDAIHYREAAMLELADHRPAAALIAARLNFETQRELADVRVLARAAMAARDAGARQMLEDWLRETGYEDAVTAAILAAGRRG